MEMKRKAGFVSVYEATVPQVCLGTATSGILRCLLPSSKCCAIWCVVGIAGLDPYSSPYMMPYDGLYNP